MHRRSLLTLALATLGGGALRVFGSSRAESAETAGVRVAIPAGAWSSVDFEYERDGRSFPGTVVRLSDDSGEKVYAACRICPHQGCTFGYETDYQQVGDIVGLDLANPVFFCRCHMSVYDPAQDGRVLFGPAPRPPWRFSIRATDKELIVTGLEPGAGDIKS